MPLSEKKKTYFICLQVGYRKVYIIGLQIKVFPDLLYVADLSSKTKFTFRQFTSSQTLLFFRLSPGVYLRIPTTLHVG